MDAGLVNSGRKGRMRMALRDNAEVLPGGKRGFTLVEMLVVIAIIALIAGILLPVLSNVRRYAHRTRMRDVVHQVKTAWETYLQDYRSFPMIDMREMADRPTNSIGPMKILGTLATTYNKSQYYLEFGTNEWKNWEMLDFWGGRIQFAIDNGRSWGDTVAYDGRVTAGAHGAVFQSVAAWSKGTRNGLNGTIDDPTDDITSWAHDLDKCPCSP